MTAPATNPDRRVEHHLAEIDAWRAGDRLTPGMGSPPGERYALQMRETIKHHVVMLRALGVDLDDEGNPRQVGTSPPPRLDRLRALTPGRSRLYRAHRENGGSVLTALDYAEGRCGALRGGRKPFVCDLPADHEGPHGRTHLRATEGGRF